MDIPAYVLLSHEQALQRRMDVVANNLANVSTTGFKRELPRFEELVRTSEGEVPGDLKPVSYVLDRGAVHDSRAGGFTATGNPLDVAIDGNGYFAVTLPDGAVAYTRAGNLELRDDGTLVTAAGLPLRGEGGAAIRVPPEAAGRIGILPDGTLAGPGGPFGRLSVTRFEDEATLTPRGDGLLDAGVPGRELAAADTKLRSGGLESSNVQPIVETTQMIEVLRAYQTSQHLSDAIGDLRKRALDRLGSFRN